MYVQFFTYPPEGGDSLKHHCKNIPPPSLKVVLGRTGEDFLHTTLNIDFEFCEKKTETFFLSVCSKFWCIIYTCLSIYNTCTLDKDGIVIVDVFPLFFFIPNSCFKYSRTLHKKIIKNFNFNKNCLVILDQI